MAAERIGHVVWKGDLAHGEGRASARSSGLFTDVPVTWASRTERSEGKTSPEELLAAAHASCFAMALSGELGDSLLALASHARGGALADLVTAALVQDLDERKAALEELHPARRLERTLENVGELMARMGAAAPRGPLN